MNEYKTAVAAEAVEVRGLPARLGGCGQAEGRTWAAHLPQQAFRWRCPRPSHGLSMPERRLPTTPQPGGAKNMRKRTGGMLQ